MIGNMIEFRKVVDFEFKDVPYTMFIDKHDHYFFLKRDEKDKYYYTTLEEQRMLVSIFSSRPTVMNILKGNRNAIVPKVISGALVVTLTAGMLSGCTNKATFNVKTSDSNEPTSIIYESNDSLDKYDFDYSSNEENDEIDVFDDFFGFSKNKYIYDSSKLDLIFENKEITIDDLYSRIDNNNQISDRIKPLIKEYCYSYVTKSPESDRRILYYNLDTLVVIECTELEMNFASFGGSTSACYSPYVNTIYILKDYEFEKGTWAFQCIFHEMGHLSRNAFYDEGENHYEMRSGGANFNCTSMDETLNTLFTCSLFDYKEQDFAYQLQSNYLDCIISSMDNYQISDYINHSQSYFVHKLDEYMNCDGYAATMMELLNAQYESYYNKDVRIRQSKLRPLYKFISDVYYKSRINSNMSYDEALAVKDELVYRVMFDVPDEYKIDVDYFDEYFVDYCKGLGINVPSRGLF